jgi:hypothetical protein
LMCKPNKFGHGMENKLGHRGFANIRKDILAKIDSKETN